MGHTNARATSGPCKKALVLLKMGDLPHCRHDHDPWQFWCIVITWVHIKQSAAKNTDTCCTIRLSELELLNFDWINHGKLLHFKVWDLHIFNTDFIRSLSAHFTDWGHTPPLKVERFHQLSLICKWIIILKCWVLRLDAWCPLASMLAHQF